jgi:glycogen debranching enzyme
VRPNQIFAISLDEPVLDEPRWAPVLDTVGRELLTPWPALAVARHPDYKPNYHGDLRTRDAAYHQGTVWSWLIGPFVDAHLRVHPGDYASARAALHGLIEHLGQACVGQISEVFDAEPPYTPRGCVAQAWGAAEVLRAWLATAGSD